MTTLKKIIIDSPTSDLEDILSPFIEEQFPTFMRSDYKKLIYFIKTYYEWLETKNNPGYVLSKMDDVFDVDKNLEEFYSNFKNTYMEAFPSNFAVNKEGELPNKITILKKIHEFYKNKGTESGYRFIFRIFYDSDIEFYYPKTDILSASSGKWIEPVSIKTTSSSDFYNFKNGRVTQYKTSENLDIIATAFIDSVVRYYQDGVLITEFFLSDIVGEFEANKYAYFNKEDQQQSEILYSVLGDFFIETPGSGYLVGDKLFIVSDGVGFVGEISVTGLGGSIKKLSITNSGINYQSEVYAIVVNYIGVKSVAKILLKPSALSRYVGYFSDNSGKISSSKHIQDGTYYQQFSYELKTQISFDKYFDVLKKIIHPAGLKAFGSILFKSNISAEQQGTFYVNQYHTPIIGEYAPYTTGTTSGLTLQYSNGYYPYIERLNVPVNGIPSVSGTLLKEAGNYDSSQAELDPYLEIGITAPTTTEYVVVGEFTLDRTAPESFDVYWSSYITPGSKYPAWGIRSYTQDADNQTRLDEYGYGSWETAQTATPVGTFENEYRSYKYRIHVDPNPEYIVGAGTIFRLLLASSSSSASAIPVVGSNTQKLYGKNFFNNLGIYSYAVLPESGTTTQIPYGRPLGSTASWQGGQENQYNITSLSGLTLWLKPENIIAIGGGSAAGASLGMWMDASPSANHGILPTWDRWNSAAATIKRPAAAGDGWNLSVWHNSPVDIVEWRLGIYGPPVSGVDYPNDPSVFQMGGFWCGGVTAGSTGEGYTGSDNALGDNSSSVGGYAKLDLAWYIFTNPTTLLPGIDIRNHAIPGVHTGISLATVATLPTTFTQSTVFGICYDYQNRNINLYADGVVYRKQGPYPIGSTFSFEIVPYGKSAEAEILKATYQGSSTGTPVPISPTGWTGSPGITFFVPYGASMEFLAPQIVKSVKGIAGRDGVSFNNGAMFRTTSVWREGRTLGVNSAIGQTQAAELISLPEVRFQRGGTAEALLKHKHFYLTKGITLNSDTSSFIVYTPNTSSDYGKGRGFVSSNGNHQASFNVIADSDRVFFCRSYNSSDRSFPNNSLYYTGITTSYSSGITAVGYPDDTGLSGFKVGDKIIAYDPHVDDYDVGTSISEFSRNSENLLESFYNGDQSKNYSPSTGRYKTTKTLPYKIEDQGVTSSDPVNILRFGSYFRSDQPSISGKNWLYDSLTYLGDGTGATSIGITTSYADTYNGMLTYMFKTGSSGNFYLQSSNAGGDDFPASQTSPSWTFSCYAKRADNDLKICNTSLVAYNYMGGTNNQFPGVSYSVTSQSNKTWVKLIGSTGPQADLITTLVGFKGLCAGVTYYISGAMLEKTNYHAPVGSTLWCDKFTQTSPYGFPGVIHEVIIFDRKLKEAERQVVYGYLSSKYTLSDVVPNDFRLSHNGSSILGTTFWEIQPHPSPGFLFGDVSIGSFINTRTSEYESN